MAPPPPDLREAGGGGVTATRRQAVVGILISLFRHLTCEMKDTLDDTFNQKLAIRNFVHLRSINVRYFETHAMFLFFFFVLFFGATLWKSNSEKTKHGQMLGREIYIARNTTSSQRKRSCAAK